LTDYQIWSLISLQRIWSAKQQVPGSRNRRSLSFEQIIAISN
jgi:hypothetical protein